MDINKPFADPAKEARFRHALQTLSKPRDAEGVDCLPPTRPAVATATPDGNDGAFLRFLAEHPGSALTLSCPKDANYLKIKAQADGLEMDMRVSFLQLDLDRQTGFRSIADVLRAIERQLFKDKPDA